MEVEDPISAKFRTLVEALMVKTTSEIVKVFAEVILETRMEISHSWREIDHLKQVLEQREKQQAESILSRFSRMTQVTFKSEENDVAVSQGNPQVVVSDSSADRPESGDEVQISEDATVEDPNIIEDSVSVPEKVTPEITPETSGLSPSVNGSNQNPEDQMTQIEARSKKRGRSRKSHANFIENQTSTTETKVMSNSPLKALSVFSPQQPSSSTGIIILSKRSEKKGAVVTRKKYKQKINSSKQSDTVRHTLRDRQLLSSQRPCLCCPSDQCSEQQSEPKKSSPVVPCVCRDCGTKLKELTEFKSHKCSLRRKCSRCGQTFTSLRTLASHSRSIHPASNRPFPYHCYLCGHMFATRCGWNIHKNIHAHGHVPENAQQDIPNPTHSFTVPKDLKTKVEVRLERISEAQLEAALSPKGSLLLDGKNSLSPVSPSQNMPSVVEPTVSRESANEPSVDTTMNADVLNEESGSKGGTKVAMECQASSSGTELSETVRQSDDGIEDSVIPSVSSPIQPSGKMAQSKSLTMRRVASMECDMDSSSANDDLPKGSNSLSRKRKMSDCNHDVYNGVFPVEKILRWRNTKGQNEVRIKWMPCSLCGAKWKNTWEPAESFISYKDGKHEVPENTGKQK